MPKPNIRKGWLYLGRVLLSGIKLEGLQKRLQSRFLSVITKKAEEVADGIFGSDIYVRGYFPIPRHLCPGYGYLPIRGLKPGEQVSENELSEIKIILSFGSDDIPVSTVIAQGPFFRLSRIGFWYEKCQGYDRVLWARNAIKSDNSGFYMQTENN